MNAVTPLSRAAVIVNPTKLNDEEAFRKSVLVVMDDHGWGEPLWLETTPEDPGRGQAESAASAGVDVVLACGGDGTVTACAEGVAGTGVPLAIIALGTGNLLARNVGLPMDLDEALAVALGGVQQPIDAGRVNGNLFVVMAGLGLDARMLSGASEPLKQRVGWLAYAISAVRHLRDRPMRAAVSADGGPRRRMRASGHRRHRRAAARQRRGLDPAEPAGTDRAGAGRLPGHPGRMADRRARQRHV